MARGKGGEKGREEGEGRGGIRRIDFPQEGPRGLERGILRDRERVDEGPSDGERDRIRGRWGSTGGRIERGMATNCRVEGRETRFADDTIAERETESAPASEIRGEGGSTGGAGRLRGHDTGN